MDEIKDAIQAARAQRITHMVSQFLKSENERIFEKSMATPEDDGVDYDDDNNEGIEKARSGVYADTAENRRLNRVGQQYGGRKQVEQPTAKTASNRTHDIPRIMRAMGESSKMAAAVESLADVDFSEMDEKEIKSVVEKLPAKKLDELYDKHIDGKSGKSDVSSHASKASDGALKRAAADENASEDVRNAAKEELKKRGGDNGNNTDYIKKIGNKEFVEGLKNDKEALKTLDKGSDEYKQTKKRVKEAKKKDGGIHR